MLPLINFMPTLLGLGDFKANLRLCSRNLGQHFSFKSQIHHSQVSKSPLRFTLLQIPSKFLFARLFLIAFPSTACVPLNGSVQFSTQTEGGGREKNSFRAHNRRREDKRPRAFLSTGFSKSPLSISLRRGKQKGRNRAKTGRTASDQ